MTQRHSLPARISQKSVGREAMRWYPAEKGVRLYLPHDSCQGLRIWWALRRSIPRTRR